MIDKKMADALNKQVHAELYSFYLYMSMSAYFSSINFLGFAAWIKVQAMEEQTHASKIYEYILDRGGKVVLAAIDAPPNEWKSPLAAFEEASQHEQLVSKLINDLVDLSMTIKDHQTNNFLQWFLTEQVEEETNADENVQKVKRLGDDKQAMYLLDKDLGMRQLTVPPWLKLNMAAGGGGGAA